MITRRDIVVSIILSFVTCGIYGYYWLYSMAEDMNNVTGDHKTSGAMVLILTIVTCNIYGIYWAFTMGDRIDKIKAEKGIPASNGGVLYLIVYLVCYPAALALMQNELNKMADAQ